MSIWLRWRYRQAITGINYAFYLLNPLVTVIMMNRNRETSEMFLRPLENARRRQQIAEEEWRRRRLRDA